MVCLHAGTMGVILRAFLSIGQGKSLPRSGISPENTPSILCIFPFCRTPTGERQEIQRRGLVSQDSSRRCRRKTVEAPSRAKPCSDVPITGLAAEHSSIPVHVIRDR